MSKAEDLVAALASYRDRQFADMLVVVIGLAAERHPDILRNALAQVFDLKATNEAVEQARWLARNVSSEVNRQAIEIAELSAVIHRTMSDLEKRIDALQAALDAA